MKRKSLCTLLSVLMLACAVPLPSFAEERAATQDEIASVSASHASASQWENTGTYWRLLYLLPGSSNWKYAKDQWVLLSGKYYYFDANGNMEEGWFQDASGKWYFAVCDSLERNNGDAGRVLTGWAAIPDGHGMIHNFYFGADANGRPTGMYQGSDGYYLPFTIDGQQYSFDGNGYCSKSVLGFSIPSYDLKRS